MQARLTFGRATIDPDLDALAGDTRRRPEALTPSTGPDRDLIAGYT